MSLPGTPDVLETLDATWPAAEIIDLRPIRLQRGEGGGKRVSAASVLGEVDAEDVTRAEAAMRGMGQRPLFMVSPSQSGLDAMLAARGYGVVDPVTLYAAPSRRGLVPPVATDWFPALEALWDSGGVGPARRAVMDRVIGDKAVLLLPDPELPEAAAFVACGGGGAMLHALHVDPTSRRRGLGRALTEGARAWSSEHGAPWLALAVTDANLPANTLYASLGFEPVGRYWYRALRG